MSFKLLKVAVIYEVNNLLGSYYQNKPFPYPVSAKSLSVSYGYLLTKVVPHWINSSGKPLHCMFAISEEVDGCNCSGRAGECLLPKVGAVKGSEL